MVNQEVIQNWKNRLNREVGLIPPEHLLLFDCLIESDEDITIFIQSFLLVSPGKNGNRKVLKQLNLEYSDFTYPGDDHITALASQWLRTSRTMDDPFVKDKVVAQEGDAWKPQWPTQNILMSEGASYSQILP